MVDLRKAYGEQFHKRHHLKLGFMSAFVKASAAALMDQPVVNAGKKNQTLIKTFSKFFFMKSNRE